VQERRDCFAVSVLDVYAYQQPTSAYLFIILIYAGDEFNMFLLAERFHPDLFLGYLWNFCRA